MNQKRQRVSPKTWEQAEKLLDIWFAEGQTRSNVLPFHSGQFSHEAALFAAGIFKRGAAGIRDLDSNEETILPPPHPKKSASGIIIEAAWTRFLESTKIRSLNPNTVTLIVDQGVARLHPEIASDAENLGFQVMHLECNESSKNLKSVFDLCNNTRSSCQAIIAVGGGICCDVAGFVGGLLDAEIVLVPTTLLATIDAGIGGKTGVNHATAGKNQIGIFADIDSVVLIPKFLETLTPQMVRDGVGEIIKHSWLSGKFEDWYCSIERLIETQPDSAFANESVIQLLKENIEFKARVVQADPFERNIRAMLNLGHTVAHLVESLSLELSTGNPTQSVPSHGQAVSLGLWSLLESGLLKNPPQGFFETLRRLNNTSGLKLPLCKLDDSRLRAISILLQDKKNILPHSAAGARQIRCILPEYGCLAAIPETRTVDAFLSTCVTEMQPDSLLEHLIRAGLFN